MQCSAGAVASDICSATFGFIFHNQPLYPHLSGIRADSRRIQTVSKQLLWENENYGPPLAYANGGVSTKETCISLPSMPWAVSAHI